MTNYIPLKYWNGSEWVNVGHPGPAGASAYEIAVANGYNGTEQQFADSLINPPAASVSLDTSSFNNNLDNSVDDVQKLAEEVDSMASSASSVSVRNNGVSMTPRAYLNFSGPGVTLVDDVSNNEIDISVGGLVPNTANRPHHPFMSGAITDFGVSGRAYYVPFIAPSRTFNTATFSVTVNDPSATVFIDIYHRGGSLSINKIHIFGSRGVWNSPQTQNSFSITAPTVWAPEAGKEYWIGVLVTGSMKLMSGTILPLSQANVGTAAFPPASAYMSSSTNLTALPDLDYAPYEASISPYGPWVLLS